MDSRSKNLGLHKNTKSLYHYKNHKSFLKEGRRFSNTQFQGFTVEIA